MNKIFEFILKELRKLTKSVNYENSFETINEKRVIESNCNAICFVSPSNNTQIVFINGWPLYPATNICLNGNSNEIDKTKYTVDMPNGNQQILIIRKINY
jgi:hypothetical protein